MANKKRVKGYTRSDGVKVKGHMRSPAKLARAFRKAMKKRKR